MLIYRALLIDTEKDYKRPVQQFFQSLPMAEDWAIKTLTAAGKGAYVQIYENRERELHQVRQVPNDQVTVQSVQ
jgi:hypothetical protein